MYFICFRWGNKPANKVWWNRTKHPKRWDSMPHCYFSLPIVYFDSPMWYIACVLLSLRWSNICCSWYAWFIVTISTWLLLLCCWYMSTPHHIFLYVSCWQTIPYCRWVIFAIHKLLVETLMYMHGSKHDCDIMDDFVWGESPQEHVYYYWWNCVRGVPPRSLMLFIDDGYKEEREICMFHVEFLHFSCHYILLDTSRNFLQSVSFSRQVLKIVSVVEMFCKFFCD